MAISYSELPGVLQAVRDRIATAAPACAKAMGDTYYDRLTKVTLRRYSHAPATKTPAPRRTGPPAWMTGDLARSVTVVRGPSSGMRASVTVGPHTVYARIQELGGHIRPVRARYLRWTEDGVTHFSKHVYIPERPYVKPTVRDVILDGSLTRAASEAYMAWVWG